MVKNAPLINEVLPHFIKFLGEDIFVAHNASFDFGFLEHNCAYHHNHNLKNHKLCTRKLANRILPNLQRKRLQDLCDYYQIVNQTAHRAMSDVEATTKVLANFLQYLQELGIHDTTAILKFEQTPRTKLILPKRNIYLN